VLPSESTPSEGAREHGKRANVEKFTAKNIPQQRFPATEIHCRNWLDRCYQDTSRVGARRTTPALPGEIPAGGGFLDIVARAGAWAVGGGRATKHAPSRKAKSCNGAWCERGPRALLVVGASIVWNLWMSG